MELPKNTDAFTESENKMLSLLRKILKQNANCLLSGSLGLKMQGIKPRRECKDIDIYIPHEERFFPLPGMQEVVNDEFDDGSDEDTSHERVAYKMDGFPGIIIDTFQAHDRHSTANYAEEYEIHEKVKCMLPEHILSFKCHHALAGSYSRYKHRSDIIYIMIS